MGTHTYTTSTNTTYTHTHIHMHTHTHTHTRACTLHNPLSFMPSCLTQEKNNKILSENNQVRNACIDCGGEGVGEAEGQGEGKEGGGGGRGGVNVI